MKRIIAGNWKMHMTISEARELAGSIVQKVGDYAAASDVIVCPAFVLLQTVQAELEGSPIQLGAQNMYHQDSGAFTGECSGVMLRDAGCRYVILGHSERRHVFGESDHDIRLKVRAAFRSGLQPILCAGETEIERDMGLTQNVVERHIRSGLADVLPEDAGSTVVAYEPVWAIGTGRTATTEQVRDVHSFIRNLLHDMYPKQGDRIPILYGGSVKPQNAADLLNQPHVNGALVGGASLKTQSFTELVTIAADLR